MMSPQYRRTFVTAATLQGHNGHFPDVGRVGRLTSILLKLGPGGFVRNCIASAPRGRSRPQHPIAARGKMSFETISLLLNWLQLGALLAIMFRLAHTFDLIANTQRELRRAIHNLGERRAGEAVSSDISGGSRSDLAARSLRFGAGTETP
jgi:hypothetical protein